MRITLLFAAVLLLLAQDGARVLALEVTQDAYKSVQWFPPAPPPSGVIMPVPAPGPYAPRPSDRELYEQWQLYGGHPVQPRYQPPVGDPRCFYRDAYGQLRRC